MKEAGLLYYKTELISISKIFMLEKCIEMLRTISIIFF